MTISKKPKMDSANTSDGKKSKSLMYVGPSISKGRLSHATVFIDGLFTVPVQEIMSEHPWMKHLMVPTSQINSAMESIKKEGTLLNTLCKRVAKEV